MRYYPFHLGDYLSHTRHLNLMEDLAYRRMLDWYYLHEAPLVGTVHDVARAIGMIEQLAAVNAVLEEFFNEMAGRWVSLRCDEVIEKYHDQQRAGREGASLRWGTKKAPNSHPTGPAVPTNNQEPITKNQKQKKQIAAPEGVDAQLWADWLALRKAKKAPVTPTVMRRLAEEAARAGWPLPKVLAEMVTRNWQGFRADWVARDGGRHNIGNTDYGSEQVQDI